MGIVPVWVPYFGALDAYVPACSMLLYRVLRALRAAEVGFTRRLASKRSATLATPITKPRALTLCGPARSS